MVKILETTESSHTWCEFHFLVEYVKLSLVTFLFFPLLMTFHVNSVKESYFCVHKLRLLFLQDPTQYKSLHLITETNHFQILCLETPTTHPKHITMNMQTPSCLTCSIVQVNGVSTTHNEQTFK